MDECVFCKIVRGELPSTKVYEDDTVLGFLDLEPKAPVHILLIPKAHIDSAAEINAENSGVVAHIFEVIAQLSREMNLKDGFRVISNCGEKAGQSVKHLHFHLLSGREFTTLLGE